MPFTSMATTPVGGRRQGPNRGVETAGADGGGAGTGGRRPDTDDADGDDSSTPSREELEATIATLEADRDRLLAERRELQTRYEQLLRERQHRERDDERRQTTRSAPPADDGLLLRFARRLGLR